MDTDNGLTSRESELSLMELSLTREIVFAISGLQQRFDHAVGASREERLSLLSDLLRDLEPRVHEELTKEAELLRRVHKEMTLLC